MSSVFSDFQLMWQQRFPESSLSDAWELDVRASLERHQQKITELTKELEQEELYVEYLERLLSDVEKYRESGTDPALLFEAPTNRMSTSSDLIAENNEGDENQLIRASSTPATSAAQNEILPKSSKKQTKDEVQLRRDGALNQFIDELSSNIHSRRYSEAPTSPPSEASVEPSDSVKSVIEKAEQPVVTEQQPTNEDREHKASKSDLSQPSHFVTVIEVKEPTAAPTATSTFKSVRGGYENVIIENNKRNSSDNDKMVQNSFTHFNNLKLTNDESTKLIRPTAPPISQDIRDMKKKIPPRPPPKFPRRAAPVDPPTVPKISANTGRKDSDSSPSSSLERNVKPSEIFRQKSSDSLDIKISSTKKENINKFSKSSDFITDEFGKKLTKSESLKSTQSSSGSLGSTHTKSTASPTGSLDKLAILNSQQYQESPPGSLGKKHHGNLHPSNGDSHSVHSTGSKESLQNHALVQGKIKSYESNSSLSSDPMKVSQNHENEPYYDSVPLDNHEGDYVYIQAEGTTNTGTGTSTGTTGSNSSRDDVSLAGSTLPLPSKSHFSSQSSVIEPESPGRSSNYVNIDYFLNHNQEARNSSIDSDGELDAQSSPLMRVIKNDNRSSIQAPAFERKISNCSRGAIINQIISSIITSETLYVECLNKMNQYMKAIRATLTTSQPVISEEDFQTMFFKTEELFEVHNTFLTDLKSKQASNTDGDVHVGDIFKTLANHMNLYGAFLHNYGRAIDTVKKCGTNSTQFKEIVSKIMLNSLNEQSLTFEDLLHKPVARVQKNALVLADLLQHTPESHADYQPLKHAHKVIRTFLSEFNVVQPKSILSDDKALRRLVKNSFIVELADGHRKLRHLFLFNDVIACAKYKSAGKDRFEYELKWFIPLKDIFIVSEESSPVEPKESSPVNIVQLKSQACTVRDQLMIEDKDEKKSGSRTNEKHRKKLADIEGQLVLASPNLVFKIGNKAIHKTMTFFLSSDFERTQWADSILALQKSCNLPGSTAVHIYELHAWISACQKIIKTEMGSYLMRGNRDESLLVGDLHLTLQGLVGLDQMADWFICIEIDSYGHYFRKAKTKMICRSSSPIWNESFVLELEGSQNIRVLLYQDDHRPNLKAKCVLELSRTWLKEHQITRPLKLTDQITLNTTLRFVPSEVTLRRVPTSKPGALFGAKLHHVIKREKREVPFLISASIREVERRGMYEVGIYRVSGSASDLAKLKKSFETNAYEAEQLLKEVDIHSVTGNLKSYLRDLPEALFTDMLYQKFFDTFNKFSSTTESARIDALTGIFSELPPANRSTITLILDHLMRVNQQESENKMSLHNLAMVFGPTLLRPGPQTAKHKDLLESSTVDVMAQAGILYCFLQAKHM